MKKIILVLTAVLLAASTFATVAPAKKNPQASSIMLPVGKTGAKISLLDLSVISTKDFQQLTGNKMNLAERMSFKLAQRQLRGSINADGTVNSKKLANVVKKADGTSGFHVGGFALGFLLGLIGVLIAYLINDDKKKNRVKWSWIGVGVGLVLWLLLIL